MEYEEETYLRKNLSIDALYNPLSRL